MPLTPPERWSTGNPLRRIRLSEAFITQTYGGAAGDVVTSMEFPTPASDNKTGTVAGTASASGTVVGSKGAAGTVAGTVTAPTATAAGDKGASGTVTGSTPSPTAAASGTAARYGTVTGEASVTGIATGTSEGGSPVEPPASGGHGGAVYAQHWGPGGSSRRVVRKSGSVHATVPVPQGTARGQRGAAGRARSTVTTYGTAVGKRAATARVDGRAAHLRSTVTGHVGARDDEYLALYAELRHQQDDADLLLML